MSSNTTIIARIYEIREVEAVGSNGFVKRSVILDDGREFNGMYKPNWLKVDFTGDRVNQLDPFQPNQLVKIEGSLEGREYQGKYYTNIRGWRIEPYTPQQAYPSQGSKQPSQPSQPQFQQYPNQAPQTQPQGYSQPSGTTYQQPRQEAGYGASQYKQDMQQKNAPNIFYSKPADEPKVEGVEDLPF